MVSEQARMAETRLNGVLARPPGTPVGPLAPPDPVPIPPAESLQALALAHQPELRGPTLEAKVAEADLAVVQSERKPDFVVQGGYMVMPDMTNAITARVGITWPTAPWVRKKFDAQRREAEARREVAQASARALGNQVGQMVQEALVRAQSAEQRAALIRDGLLPQAAHGLELARLSYQTDRGSFLEVIDAARVIVDLQRDLVRAEADRQLAVVALERATGTDLLAGGAPSQGALR